MNKIDRSLSVHSSNTVDILLDKRDTYMDKRDRSLLVY
jgi:hypothetical protein